MAKGDKNRGLRRRRRRQEAKKQRQLRQAIATMEERRGEEPQWTCGANIGTHREPKPCGTKVLMTKGSCPKGHTWPKMTGGKAREQAGVDHGRGHGYRPYTPPRDDYDYPW